MQEIESACYRRISGELEFVAVDHRSREFSNDYSANIPTPRLPRTTRVKKLAAVNELRTRAKLAGYREVHYLRRS